MSRSDGRSKRAGRPRGSSKKLDAVREMIAAGVEPLEAFARGGYTDPYRARKHHAAQVAEAAVGADPRAVLENIAMFGRPDDRVRACRDLLALFHDERPKQAAAPIVSIEDAREMTAEQRSELKRMGKPIYTMPNQLEAAMRAWDTLCAGGSDVDATAAVSSTGCNPIRILEDVIVKGECGDEVLRHSAVLLIKQNAAKPTEDGARYVFVIPMNDRVPFDVATAHAIVVTAQAGVNARGVLHQALEERDKSLSA